jgi:4'-phosphopantetheinyl transferase
VVFVSEPIAMCGVDVAAPGQARRKNRDGRFPSVAETLETFRGALTPEERETIVGHEDETSREEAFRRHWSCKEAFVKAMGVGLGMELNRACFSFEKQTESTYVASVAVDGTSKPKWRFRTERVGGGDTAGSVDDGTDPAATRNAYHWITTARGPLEDVTDAFGEFRKTWRDPTAGSNDDERWRTILDAPAPPFTALAVSDLLPKEIRDEYEKQGGEVSL